MNHNKNNSYQRNNIHCMSCLVVIVILLQPKGNIYLFMDGLDIQSVCVRACHQLFFCFIFIYLYASEEIMIVGMNNLKLLLLIICFSFSLVFSFRFLCQINNNACVSIWKVLCDFKGLFSLYMKLISIRGIVQTHKNISLSKL